MIEYREAVQGDSKHLIVAFTGVSQALGAIPFEFFKSVGNTGANALYVRDKGQHWYQYDQGVIDEIALTIENFKQKVRAEKVLFLGNSMGGFGALLFGAICKANAILAFAPQTTILPEQTAAIGDMRWRVYQDKITEYPAGDLNAFEAPTGHATIIYSQDEARDVAHVERLKWPSTRIARSNGGHDVAATLKQEGSLMTTIIASLEAA